MAVKSSHTGTRVLKVLEAVAGHQPIGVRALARILGEDKSAIHRAIITLADEGWIQPTTNQPVQWQVSPRILAVADMAYGGLDLKQRALPVLQRLRDEFGETALLIVPDVKNLVVAEVVESPQMLRVVAHVGNVVTTEDTATGRAILPFLDHSRQVELLGHEPGPALEQIYKLTRERGFAISDRETNPEATSLSAPVFEFDGSPCGAIALIGPSDRLPSHRHEEIGRRIVLEALSVSRGVAKRLE